MGSWREGSCLWSFHCLWAFWKPAEISIRTSIQWTLNPVDEPPAQKLYSPSVSTHHSSTSGKKLSDITMRTRLWKIWQTCSWPPDALERTSLRLVTVGWRGSALGKGNSCYPRCYSILTPVKVIDSMPRCVFIYAFILLTLYTDSSLSNIIMYRIDLSEPGIVKVAETSLEWHKVYVYTKKRGDSRCVGHEKVSFVCRNWDSVSRSSGLSYFPCCQGSSWSLANPPAGWQRQWVCVYLKSFSSAQHVCHNCSKTAVTSWFSEGNVSGVLCWCNCWSGHLHTAAGSDRCLACSYAVARVLWVVARAFAVCLEIMRHFSK